MQTRSLLQLLAPLALATLMLGCGSDDASDNGDEPIVKNDAGIKRRDAGSKATEADDDESTDDEDEAGDESSARKDAGAAKGGKVAITGDSEDIACEKNADCPGDELSDSVGCCDQPTKVCFLSEGAKCPASAGGGISQPAYN